ncbi:MAG: ABC transporter permease, partial [Pleurocapsa sp. SU_196_0]|nr:ABC transporter permease [Pleurocapsa sp. SU_196_0]
MNPLSTARLIVHVAWTEALHALRQPRLMAQLFILPIIFSTILAIFQTSEVAPARVLMTRPNSTLALELEARLKGLNLSVEAADARARFLLARSDRDAWLILPEDFDEQVLNGKPKLELITPSNNSRSIEVFERVRSAIAEMQAPSVSASAAPGTDAAERTRRLMDERFVRVETVQTQVTQSSSILSAGGSNQTAPGMTLMFALLFGAQTGLSFQRERTMGTLTRLFSAPTSSFVIVLGKLLGNTLLLLL